MRAAEQPSDLKWKTRRAESISLDVARGRGLAPRGGVGGAWFSLWSRGSGAGGS